jgi:hypothetical protein
LIIREDDCKKWEIGSATLSNFIVAGSSLSEVVEDVDVTFCAGESCAGAVQSGAVQSNGFINVGEGGNAKGTNIKVNGLVYGGLKVGGNSGQATDTTIDVAGDVCGKIYVNYFGQAGTSAVATNTNINVGGLGRYYESGLDCDGEIIVYSGATNTTITITDGPPRVGRTIQVDAEATNTNVFVENVKDSFVFISVDFNGDPTKIKCNGITLRQDVSNCRCSAPGSQSFFATTCY